MCRLQNGGHVLTREDGEAAYWLIKMGCGIVRYKEGVALNHSKPSNTSDIMNPDFKANRYL